MGSLPGGGDPDYSSLAAWEADSDNDLSGTGITTLECYDSQTHDDSCSCGGATNTDSTHYRVIRSSSSCSTPWAGKENTGANFVQNSTQNTFYLAEAYFRLIDVYTESEFFGGRGAYAYNALHVKVLNCIAVSNGGRAIYAHAAGVFLAYNCIARDSYDGFYAGSGSNKGFICCTSVNNSNYGFYCAFTAVSAPTIVWSSYGANNSTEDFRDNSSYWKSISGWNSSKDNTSDLGGLAGNDYKNGNDLITGGELDSDYLPTEHIYWTGGAGDNAGRNPYNDISSVIDFADFFKNDTDGEIISKKDIRGVDRPTPDTADVSWDVGAAEYTISIETLTPDETTINLTCDSPTLLGTILIPNETTINLTCDQPNLQDILVPDEITISLSCDETYAICLPDDIIINLTCDSPIMATLVIDWSIASVAIKELNTDYTCIIGFYGARDGQICILVFKQDATGGRQVELPSNVRPGEYTLPLTLSGANLSDYVKMIYREDTDTFDLLEFRKGYGTIIS